MSRTRSMSRSRKRRRILSRSRSRALGADAKKRGQISPELMGLERDTEAIFKPSGSTQTKSHKLSFVVQI